MPVLARQLTVLTLTVAALLLAPLLAMQVTDEVAWSAGDFIAAGTLLFGAGLAYILISNRWPARRLPVAIVIAGALLLVWAQLAVGLFDGPFAGT